MKCPQSTMIASLSMLLTLYQLEAHGNNNTEIMTLPGSVLQTGMHRSRIICSANFRDPDSSAQALPPSFDSQSGLGEYQKVADMLSLRVSAWPTTQNFAAAKFWSPAPARCSAYWPHNAPPVTKAQKLPKGRFCFFCDPTGNRTPLPSLRRMCPSR